ncbi:MAG: MmcQ/YjbR family DNA-binding protein [Tetrasphaera sp.]|nr:MmcQ/YjbR family DNA-binding protein [Tetrasphaera sp.]
MATDADLERLALALPGVELGTFWGGPAYVVAGKAIANRRPPRHDEGAVDPVTGEPYADLLTVHLGGSETKTEVLATFDPEVVFTIPHFARSAAVLAHMDRIEVADLEDLLDLAWAGRAPKQLVAERNSGGTTTATAKEES